MMNMEKKDRERESETSEQVVNPYKVSGKDGKEIDYDKLIDKFGCQRLDESLIDRVQRLTSRQPHEFLRRGVFFAHRDFNEILDAYERGDKFYLYTGRGPSSEALHLGHLIPFLFTKYLQEAFKVPLVIQLTDDEKFMWRKDLTVEECKRLARENAKDIIACGFDVTKTFIFSDFGYNEPAFRENVAEISKRVTLNQVIGIFGFSGEDNIGKIAFPPVQAAPSFPSSFPHLFPGMDNLRCLIPCAIDQGSSGKMSASDPNSAIYLTDTAKDIKKKINSALSGGHQFLKEQKKHGANLEEDVPFKYLSFFLNDDSELEHIRKEYGEPGGGMQSGYVKNRLAEVLTEIVERHRTARAAVTEEMVDAFMGVRPLPSMFE
ncbi:unnamed protein product [Microthlaspi erraticum]|uniref:Tryptophan--tRNA ligase, cytoplasmic n=1 Tax=Microthlaspi erraticum TaxID=1685480 RepID=A0A6D2IW64_9BRAS|nr:unnamed protein product [Microthlaspi erraticum]